MEPTYITFKNPHGGLGLRARTAAKAIERLQGLFAACAADLEFEHTALRVGDPAEPALVAAIAGEHLDGDFTAGGTQFSVAWVGGLTFDGPVADLLARHGHTPCDIAALAFDAFGPPNSVDVDTCDDTLAVFWSWDSRAPAPAEGTPYAPLTDGDFTAAHADWEAFLRRHHQPIFGEYNPQVQLDAEWSFRMIHPTTGEPADPAYPRSHVDATLSGRWSSAFLELVFPFAEPTDEFARAYEKVCDGLGMKIPAKALRIDAPTKKGDRKRNKLPPWAHG